MGKLPGFLSSVLEVIGVSPGMDCTADLVVVIAFVPTEMLGIFFSWKGRQERHLLQHSFHLGLVVAISSGDHHRHAET